MMQREVNVDYQKWVRKLLGFNFKVQYKPGIANRVADALSRKKGEQVSLGTMLTITTVDWRELETEIAYDRTIQRIHQALTSDQGGPTGFYMVENKVLYKGRRIIPHHFKFIPVLLQKYHDSIVGEVGAQRGLKTYLRIAEDWFWEGMRQNITHHVQQCKCASNRKTPGNHPQDCFNH